MPTLIASVRSHRLADDSMLEVVRRRPCSKPIARAGDKKLIAR
ncbi:hypothetical protein [Lentzea sp. NPDC003310]